MEKVGRVEYLYKECIGCHGRHELVIPFRYKGRKDVCRNGFGYTFRGVVGVVIEVHENVL